MSGLRLYLLRHAKSSPAAAGMADFDRPLADIGRHAAAAVGRLMAREGYLPTLVLCSTAQRTRETLAGVLPHLAEAMTVELTRRIYDAGADQLADLLREAGLARSVMIVGHNPAIEQLARALARDGSDPALRQMATKYPPGALAVIEFDSMDWHQAIVAGGYLRTFLTPQ